jgi:allantoinase
MPVAIVSRRVVTEGTVRPAAVVIDGDRIIGVTSPRYLSFDIERYDVGDAVVMPGVVDTHVHINEPGRTDWEGFTTATQAAAAGGVTTLVDMPLNCIPVTTTGDALQAKLDACQGQLWVDVGFWGGVVPGNTPDLVDLADGGVLGCKAFMIDSGIPEFEWSSEENLRKAMPGLAELGLPLLAHAELDLGAEPTDDDPTTYRSFLKSRPRRWEDAAIALLIRLCRQTGCAVHIVHLSSADSLPQIRDAKAEGLPVTVETCAHYLCLFAEGVEDGDTWFKCCPPIREAENRTRLWKGLRDGIIDFVVTDHSPCTPELKKREQGDFHEAWGGISSLQLGLPAVWTEAKHRDFGLVELSRWLSERPARFAGIADRKGRIERGMDADLVIWDPDAKFEVTPDSIRYRHKISPYMGRTLHGVVRETWVRGKPVFENDQVADTPRGRVVLGREDSP